ncbi:hypothetical protein NOC27_895 [Nitrosococcus oceani AFC27]|nr:hypothetical protein NOC27_895 [Nitrosococcus oceani AFC27]
MKQFNDQISNVARLPGIAQYAFCMLIGTSAMVFLLAGSPPWM